MNEKELAQRLLRLVYDFQLQNDAPGRKKRQMNQRDMMILRGILHLSSQRGQARMSQIRQYFHVSPAAVSQGIRSFEKQGWVERILSDDDRRSVSIRITERGRHQLQKREEELSAKMAAFLRYLGEEDSLHLIRIVEKSTQYAQLLHQQETTDRWKG